MAELLLKLIGPVIPVVAALIQLGRESGWLSGGTLHGPRWTFALIGTIIVGGAFNSAMTWQTHQREERERERIERTTEGREQRARKERQEIAKGITNLEFALGREHDPNLTLQEALSKISTDVHNLRQQASTLGNEVEGLRKYSSVAKLNAMGLTGIYGEGLEERTSISRALEGAYESIRTEGQEEQHPGCDDERLTLFRKVAKEHPNFPFAHWAIAGCLGKVGNPDWHTHAKRAMAILRHTTQIEGHHPHHSEVRQKIGKWLNVE